MALSHNNVGKSTVCYVVFPNHTHLNQNMYILFGLRENHFPYSGTGVIGRDTCIGLI